MISAPLLVIVFDLFAPLLSSYCVLLRHYYSSDMRYYTPLLVPDMRISSAVIIIDMRYY
jgi:hypothetical protein